MSRIDELNQILAQFQSSSSDTEACAVVSEEGLIMASSLPQGIEEARVAAMSAALLAMGTRTAAELKRGKLEQLYVKGAEGSVIIMQAGAFAVLIAMTRKDAKLGLIFLDMSRAAEAVAKALS
jgi:uncharacterized protein